MSLLSKKNWVVLPKILNIVAIIFTNEKTTSLGACSLFCYGTEETHPTDSGKRAEEIKKKAIKDGLWKDPGKVELPKQKLPQK